MIKILHYFHITHTKEDYYGSPFYLAHPPTRPEIYAEWDTVWARVQEIVGSCGETGAIKVYQDSFAALPDGIDEVSANSPLPLAEAMSRWLMERESPNIRILRYLFAHGCRFVRTEKLDTHPLRNPALYANELNLTERDPFIAEQINSTLQEGELGILFLGKKHGLDGFLKSDIQVVDYFKDSKTLSFAF
jgi:hypothetical protein